jgi:hypothetical protein
MVKLIRITTNSTDGTFDTAFRSPVNVKEGAKIALQNLIMAVQNKEIIIDATNDEMFFSVSGGTVRSAFLTRATYDKVNAQSGLLKDIQDQLNGALVFEGASGNGGKELGCQWKVSFGTRITIQNNFSKTASYVDEFAVNSPKESAVSNIRTIAQSNSNANFVQSQNSLTAAGGAATSTNDACGFLNQPICKGTGFFRCKIHTLVDDATVDTSGFIIGLAKGEVSQFFKGNPPVASNQFLEKDFFYACHINQLAQPIRVFKQGNASNTAFTPNGLGMVAGVGDDNNAVVSMEVTENKMRIKVYFNGGNQLIDEISLQSNGNSLNIGTQDYTPFIVYRGAHNNTRTVNHKFIQDPYVDNPSKIEDHDTELGLPSPPTQAGAKRLTKQEVGFVSDDLAAELGYVPRRFPPVQSALLPVLVWTADNDFEVLTVNDNYMVILDNHYLDSYDSLEKGQRSIVAVLPVKDDIGAIRFDSNYPIYVDLNNKLPISMRNIRVRVIRADGTQVNSIGLSTATLLIEE